jgi:hypothetical protein
MASIPKGMLDKLIPNLERMVRAQSTTISCMVASRLNPI